MSGAGTNPRRSAFNADGSARRNSVFDVLRHIAGYACAHGGKTPDVKTIATDLGMSAGWVKKLAERLERLGAIEIGSGAGVARPGIIRLIKTPDFIPVPQPPWFDLDHATRADWGGVLPTHDPHRLRRTMRQTPGFYERKPDPDMGTTTPHCFDRDDGRHFCMAHQTLVASRGGLILLMIEDAKQALFIEMTPAGIRQFCSDLLTVAAKVEAQHVATSNTQLAETLARNRTSNSGPQPPA